MKFKKVPQRQRANFPGKYFNDSIFDVKVFNIADHMIKDYAGGQWDYIIIDEQIPFMCLDDNVQILINPFSHEEVQTPRLIAWMIVTSYAMLMQIEKGRSKDAYIEAHYALNTAIRNYCRDIEREDVWSIMMD